MVNLAAFNSNGVMSSHTSVTLLQDGDVPPEYGRYAEWMPYQIGQAKQNATEGKVK